MTADSTSKNKKLLFLRGKRPFSRAKKPFLKNNVQVKTDASSTESLSSEDIKQLNFTAAGLELIRQEECLFALKQDGLGSSKIMVEEGKNEEEILNKKFEDLFREVWSSVGNSLNVQTSKEKEILKSAFLAIQQEEEQDKRWEDVEKSKRPPWRPRACKKIHDSLLQNLVALRMEDATLDINNTLKSSVQKELTAKAKQLKEDLIQVAKHVKSCYPGENIVQQYAEFYHQEFRARLCEITNNKLVNEDCTCILQWVNIHYPKLLKHEELSEVINSETLGPLLTAEVYDMLEDQFLTYIENELQTRFQNALSSKEIVEPKLQDECYYSPLAHALIPCIHGILTTTHDILPFGSKTVGLTYLIHRFFTDYQNFLKKVIDDNLKNTESVLKANLYCVREFKDYILKTNNCFTEETKNNCITLLVSIRDDCHGYFTQAIHNGLKKTYSKLGTKDWLKNNKFICDELIGELDRHIQNLQNLDQTCLKEIISQLHEEVMVKYVRKFMKKELKLKSEEKQHLAAELLQKDSQKMHTFFTKAGSDKNGLKEILPRLAELLTLNDPHCIELQLVMLSKDYPDFSEEHVTAWLNMKANLSTLVLKTIKTTFYEHQNSSEKLYDSTHPCSNFFSKVKLKKQLLQQIFLY